MGVTIWFLKPSRSFSPVHRYLPLQLWIKISDSESIPLKRSAFSLEYSKKILSLACSWKRFGQTDCTRTPGITFLFRDCYQKYSVYQLILSRLQTNQRIRTSSFIYVISLQRPLIKNLLVQLYSFWLFPDLAYVFFFRRLLFL